MRCLVGCLVVVLWQHTMCSACVSLQDCVISLLGGLGACCSNARAAKPCVHSCLALLHTLGLLRSVHRMRTGSASIVPHACISQLAYQMLLCGHSGQMLTLLTLCGAM